MYILCVYVYDVYKSEKESCILLENIGIYVKTFNYKRKTNTIVLMTPRTTIV